MAHPFQDSSQPGFRQAELEWLDELGDPPQAARLLKELGMDLGSRIACFEAQGVTRDTFVEAWTQGARKRLDRDPAFNAQRLSGSAWWLGHLRPSWKEALHERLVEAFLGPWLDAFFTRFPDEASAQARLRWKECVKVVGRSEARARLRSGGLIPEISGLRLRLEAESSLDWDESPPVNLSLSGGLREIRRLGRPSDLLLEDCPDLEEVRGLRVASGRVWVQSAPRLAIPPSCAERIEGVDWLPWRASFSRNGGR